MQFGLAENRMNNTIVSAAVSAIFLISFPLRCGATDDSRQRVPDITRQVQLLADMVRQPGGWDPADIAQRFGAGYERGDCNDLTVFGTLCSYTIFAKEAAVGAIADLTLSPHGGPHSELTWKLQGPGCMSEAEVEKILGKGQQFGVSMPLLLPGQADRPPAYRQVSYDAIHGAVQPALASTLYNGKCLTQVKINLLKEK